MRAYGTGSVQKKQRKRKDGSIAVYFEAYVYDTEGMRQYGRGKNAKEAFAAARIQRSAPKPPEFDCEKERVWCLYDFALECLNRDQIREQSAKRYREIAKALTSREYAYQPDGNPMREAVVIGSIRLDKLTFEDVEVFLSKFRADYTARSESVMRTVLSRTFRKAVRRGWLPRNFVQDLDRLVLHNREREALTDEYMSAMIAGATTPQMKSVLLLMTLGLRIDEALGATEDELEDDYLHVRHQQVRLSRKTPGSETDPKTEPALGPTKRFSSIRKVKLPSLHLESLKESLANAKPTRIWTSEARDYEEKKFFAPNRDGTCWSYNAFRTAYHKLRESLGLKHSTPHDWRATTATNSIEAGYDPKAVAKTLGHSRPDQTLAIYTRTRRSTTDAVSESIGRRIQEGLDKERAKLKTPAPQSDAWEADDEDNSLLSSLLDDE